MSACKRLLLVLLWVFAARSLGADERILDYHSDIAVQRDGSLTVTETIRVRAEGKDIRRGIYRDFPTRYRDRAGNRYRVGFQVLDVQRDGADEPYHLEGRSNGIRLYIGSSGRLLAPGEYEYRIVYRTIRQLGFFEAYDELYWNVTGNGWVFPIDHASARITLPAQVAFSDLCHAVYTGAQEETGQDAEFRVTGSRTAEFATTRGLGPREGLTVALAWPKGLVREPTATERVGYFMKDNGSALVLSIGLLLPLAWYLRSWHHYGRDPRKGVIIPRFEPPTGLSPAGCRYVMDMGPGNEAFTAAVVSLAVKGHARIDEKDGAFVLYRDKRSRAGEISAGEAAVLNELLPEADSWIELDQENYREFVAARKGLRDALKAEHHGRLFRLNGIYALPAVLISVLAVVFAISRDGGPLPWILFIVLTIAMHLLFLFLLRAPTPAGRKVMDEIEGFRMYLDTAEQDRLDRMKSPRLTPEVFEMFLPYAFALGVENTWCRRFAREFPAEVAEGGRHSAWYNSDRGGSGNIHRIGSRLGSSLGSAISSASSPPGSSSGSGGGGFSGGGGGGGGGGGW